MKYLLPFLLVLAACKVPQQQSVTSTPLPTPNETKVELVSYQTETMGDYITVHGQAKNVSNEPFEFLSVVVSVYDIYGTFQKSEYTYVEFNPLAPGQTSPFRVTFKPPDSNGQNIGFEFKDRSGAKLKHFDRVKGF